MHDANKALSTRVVNKYLTDENAETEHLLCEFHGPGQVTSLLVRHVCCHVVERE